MPTEKLAQKRRGFSHAMLIQSLFRKKFVQDSAIRVWDYVDPEETMEMAGYTLVYSIYRRCIRTEKLAQTRRDLIQAMLTQHASA